MDKRRAAVLALLSAVLGAAALFLGAGSASASNPYCATDGDTGDVTFGVSPLFFVAVDVESPSTPSPGSGFWACLVPPNQGAGVGFRDDSTGTAGYQLEITTCGALTGGGCMTVDDTGAEVDPTTTADAPLSGGTTTGGSAGIGGGTCVYADGTPTCPLPTTTLVGLTVNEADIAVGTHPNTGCVTAAGDPCVTTVPTGMGVSYFKGDPANDTVTAEVAGTSHSQDLGDCAGVNSGPGC